MDRAVGVGEDEFPEAIRGVVRAHEATRNPGGGPFRMQGVGVRHVDVDHAASTFRVSVVRFGQVERHRTPVGKSIPGSFVHLEDETKVPLAIHRRGEVGHVHDRCDLLELDIVHGFLESLSSATLLGGTFGPQVKRCTARIDAQSQTARTAEPAVRLAGKSWRSGGTGSLVKLRDRPHNGGSGAVRRHPEGGDRFRSRH